MSNPLISILTPTFNREPWLPLTLNSLVKQTYQNWECIVQNDAGRSVKQIVDQFNDPRIKYFENEKNLDLAGTRNAAIANSLGEFYVILDDDDILYEESLEFRMSMIKKYNADVVYTHALKMIYERQGNSYRLAGNVLYWHSENIKDLLLVQNLAPCNCYLWSRKAQEKAGLFDTTLTTSEDWAHTVEMRQYFEFFGTNIIDCACSWRNDSSQMTGSRSGYTDHLPYLYGKWRKYAENLNWVIEHQNNSLRARGLEPKNFNL